MVDFHCFFVIERLENEVNTYSRNGGVPMLKNQHSMNSGTAYDDHSAPLVTSQSDGNEPKEMPIKMMFWIDSNWEGVWVDELNYSITGNTSTQISVFALKKRIEPLLNSTLNKHHDNVHKNTLALVDRRNNFSAKIQFFTHPHRTTNMPDFRFMSACPLSFFLDKEHFHLGLWNYNVEYCDYNGKPMPNYLLTIVNHNYNNSPIPSIPSSSSLTCIDNGPNLAHHKKVVRMTNWISNVLDRCFPGESTQFKTLRTYCRAAWMTTFFFDLHKLYDTCDEGSNLPPILALYVVCNACIVNEILPEYFLHALQKRDQGTINIILSVVRDIIMCFTMCQREGLYRDDLSLGVFVEDQPFSFAVRPPSTNQSDDDNVFDEDDCEGHNQQGCIHVKGLFRLIAKDNRDNNLRNVMDHLNKTEYFCLPEDHKTRKILLDICVILGDLFEQKTLDAIMCEGDVCFSNFASLSDNTKRSDKKGAALDGHSFGLLLYKSKDVIIGSMILETTGWSTKTFGSSTHIRKSRNSNEMIRDKILYLLRYSNLQRERTKKIIIRTSLDEEKEDGLYVRVFSGDNALFFTYRGNGTLTYGACPSHIFKYARIYNGESKAELLETKQQYQEKDASLQKVIVLIVSPEQFFKSLNDRSSPWGAHDGAAQMLQEYIEIKRNYPSFRKCLMPPQITEEEFLRKIKTCWGKINDDDLKPLRQDLTSSVFSFSCRVDPNTRNIYSDHDVVENVLGDSYVKQWDFMQSKLFIVRPLTS